MKFAFVFDGIGYGGIERVGVTYCNALKRRGHEVYVINLVPSQSEFVSQLDNSISYFERPLSRAMAPERYCTLIKRYEWGRFLYPAAFLSTLAVFKIAKPFKSRGLPTVDVAIGFSGHYNDLTFVALGCVKARKRIAWLHGTINSYALVSDGYLNLYKHFDGLVCLSDEGFEEFKDANKYLKFTTKKIYNPIMQRNEIRDKQLTDSLVEAYGEFVLSAGRFEHPKDFSTLIHAMRLLKDEYGLMNKCVILGDGKDFLSTKELVSDLGLDDQIVFVGYCDNPYPFYDACKLFVLSSKNEGLPTVLLEAMSSKKPIVSTNTPGAKEIVGDSEYGMLCRISDPQDMADRIASLIKDESLYAEYACKSFERIADFTPDQAIDSITTFAAYLLSLGSSADGE